ncbi:aldolase/citrate lyase family protein [Christensenella tenuis]|uniref:Citrate lyase beta subunit n=1 Tax=Christensenella tenuis TaxID=2763033 RepID=A0ABR7EDX5_9FIRM|nr:aldolase/citrate lyase family protein [Christensenella tenuis]MBC5647858.1 citrate lyase beta subunit [Christensenella tenuis]
MNLITKEMLDVLKQLRDEYGILAVKAEFEAEGSRTDELISLNEVVFRADMKMFIKIGGCEAVRDMDQCRLLGARGIMAPMIETPFAMQKFRDASNKVFTEHEQKDIEFIINAETGVALQNFDGILAKGKGLLDTISIGRVDLSASVGLSRKEINSDQVFDMAKEFAEKALANNVKVGFGGGISFDAIPFIRNMEPFVSRFETRKIVFDLQNCKDKMEEAILCAMHFEYLYLKGKCAFYDRMAKEDENRMIMLKQRIDAAEGKDADYC